MRTQSVRRLAAATIVLALGATGCAGREERAGTSGQAGQASQGSGGASGQGGASWSAGRPSIRVGLIAPLTGPFAVLGISQRNSMQVEMDRINAAGGLGGARLELVERDSGLDPGKAVQAANELAGDSQVGLIVGPSISAFYNAAKGVYESQQKVNCQPAVATGDFGTLKYGFRSQDVAAQGIEKMIAFLKAQGVQSIGVIYEGDDTGKAISSSVQQNAEKQGLRFAGFEQTRPDDQSHRPYVDKLGKADAIWLSNNASGAKTLAAAGEAGYKGKLVSGSGMQNINFLEAAGDAAKGAYFYAPYYPYPTRGDRSEWHDGYRRHIEAVVSKFGENVGQKTGAKSPQGTAIAADCIFAFERAANQAKTVQPDPLAQAWAALDVPENETPSGNSLNLGPEHEHYDIKDIRLYQWNKDGQGWYTKDVTPS